MACCLLWKSLRRWWLASGGKDLLWGHCTSWKGIWGRLRSTWAWPSTTIQSTNAGDLFCPLVRWGGSQWPADGTNGSRNLAAVGCSQETFEVVVESKMLKKLFVHHKQPGSPSSWPHSGQTAECLLQEVETTALSQEALQTILPTKRNHIVKFWELALAGVVYTNNANTFQYTFSLLFVHITSFIVVHRLLN